jgi:hypothetical protein
MRSGRLGKRLGMQSVPLAQNEECMKREREAKVRYICVRYSILDIYNLMCDLVCWIRRSEKVWSGEFKFYILRCERVCECLCSSKKTGEREKEREIMVCFLVR